MRKAEQGSKVAYECGNRTHDDYPESRVLDIVAVPLAESFQKDPELRVTALDDPDLDGVGAM